MGAIQRSLVLMYAQLGVTFAGLCVSLYALGIELYIDAHPDYTPSCDLSAYVSCSKALLSKWGTGLGLIAPIMGEESLLNQKNPVYGISIYVALVILALMHNYRAATLSLYIVGLANITSVYLAYILYFEVEAFCVVCVSMYSINAILLPLGVWRRRAVRAMEKKKSV